MTKKWCAEPGEDVCKKLPCGKLVNQNYQPGMKVESCRTVCPDKDFKAIDKCYEEHKPKYDHLSRYGQDFVNVNSQERLFNH